MINQLLQHLNSQVKLVLASSSPRRLEILGIIGLKPEVIVSGFAEDIDKTGLTPQQYVEATASAKARSVHEVLASSGRSVDVIVGVDTVVESAGVILEKPDDAQHALRMLQSLSGGRHSVHTGVALKFMDGSSYIFHETTYIEFAAVSTEALEAYVATGEPMDKAGGFGIQGAAAAFISGINGCYYNVMGLPLHKFCAELCRFLHMSEGTLHVAPPLTPDSK